MSIFGEGVCRRPNIDEVLSDYAKKDYVDAQDGLRVLKTGDTMSGDLNMERGAVRGLPMNINTRVKGDEAVSQYQVVEIISKALRHFRAIRRPLITVWAENKRSMVNNRYEWSFGSDATRGFALGGYPMMAAGKVLRMGLSTTTSGSAPAAASFNIVVGGVANMSYGVTKPSGQYSSTSTFRTPLGLARGDIINFRSASSNPEIAGAVVSLLIELDL